jgi:hypothetical protein
MCYLLSLIIHWEPYFNHLTATVSPPLLPLVPADRSGVVVVPPHVSHAVYRGLLCLFERTPEVEGHTFASEKRVWCDSATGRVVCDASADALLRRASSIGLDPHARASGCNVFSHEVNKDTEKRREASDSPFQLPINMFTCSELLRALAKAGADCANIDRNGNTILHSMAADWHCVSEENKSHFNAVKELVKLCREQYGLSFFTQNKQGVTPIQSFEERAVARAFVTEKDMLTEEEKTAIGEQFPHILHPIRRGRRMQKRNN